MVDVAYFLVSEDIAARAGLITERYITNDGRYVLDNKDLERVKLTSEEFVNGLSGIQQVTSKQAKEYIAQNGYAMTGNEGIENNEDTEEE